MVYTYGIILKKNQIDVSYACFKNLSKSYLQNNDYNNNNNIYLKSNIQCT